MKKLTSYIVLIALLISLAGCSSITERVNEAITPVEESMKVSEESVEATKEVIVDDERDGNESDIENENDENFNFGKVQALDLKAQAQKEGVSVKEMKATLKGLVELGAEKYGVSKEAYISQIQKAGNTVLEEWQMTSEMMGVSITELYKLEKQSMAGKTKEEKETLAAMGAAIEELGELGDTLQGLSENNGEIHHVNGEFKDIFYYEVSELINEYVDEYSSSVEYASILKPEEMVSYYEKLLIDTENYLKLDAPGSPGAMIQGMFNGAIVFVEVMEIDTGTYVNCYLDLSSI